jgi:3-dehydroshikimate dehydratase
MKISFCSIAFRKTAEPLTNIIPMVCEVGYDGIEIWGNHLASDGTDLPLIREALERHRLAVPMISPYFNVTGGESDWDRSRESARACLDYAVALKVPLIRTFTGFIGSEEADPDLWAAAAKRLALLCDMAAEANVALALETHPKTLVDTVPAIKRLLGAVDRPNLRLNLDIYHLWERHGDPLWVWSELKPYVRHIHAKNALIPPDDGDYPLFHDKQGLQEIIEVTYLADGNMDYRPFLARLRNEEFGGWISIEWFGRDPLGAARHELDWLRSEMASGAL